MVTHVSIEVRFVLHMSMKFVKSVDQTQPRVSFYYSPPKLKVFSVFIHLVRMHSLVNMIAGGSGGKQTTQSYAADHERSSEELEFLSEMIHNVEMELNVYQQEFSKMASDGKMSQMVGSVGKILRRTSDEKLVWTNI